MFPSSLGVSGICDTTLTQTLLRRDLASSEALKVGVTSPFQVGAN